MILYVDETEYKNKFFVVGFLASSKEDVELAYKQFKNKITSITAPLSAESKSKLYNEFKSTRLDRTYPKIKIRMLETLNDMNYKVFYAKYLSNTDKIKNDEKKKAYIELLSSIIERVHDDVNVIFDNTDYNDEVVYSIKENISNAISIEPKESFIVHGIQFADNLCSVIRRNDTTTDENNFYELIEKHVISVDKNNK